MHSHAISYVCSCVVTLIYTSNIALFTCFPIVLYVRVLVVVYFAAGVEISSCSDGKHGVIGMLALLAAYRWCQMCLSRCIIEWWSVGKYAAIASSMLTD